MSIPDSVTALAQARMDARAAKDFALADKYRDELLQAGFEVVDVAGGYELKPKKPYITLAYPRDIRTIDLEKDVTVVAEIAEELGVTLGKLGDVAATYNKIGEVRTGDEPEGH